MIDNSPINEIIIKTITDSALTSAESALLDQWLADAENSKLFENLKNKDYLLQKLKEAHDVDMEGDKVLLQQKLGIGKRIHIRRQWNFRYVATPAAAVLILAAASILWFINRKPVNKPVKENTETVTVKDIQPGKSAALLTLADGNKLKLSSSASRKLAQQGAMVLLNENGTLKYQGQNGPQNGELFNTLSTANAQTYAMELADGSKVWLNTGASIRYPVAFTGNERKVEITGEAYFEVAHDKTRPFIVHVPGNNGNGMDVQVLGTHFNINAYNEAAVIKTTLLEGSVKIKQGNMETLLKPRQQAQVGNGTTKVLKEVDVKAAVAWKNGLFNFDNADITAVMDQLTKWYNVEAVYEGPKPTKLFMGGTGRDQLLSDAVKILELTGGVHFKIEGTKLIVMTPETYEARKNNAKQPK
ncbi:hypothetical protein A3860_22145 [Niastella vici]|uniref:Iron dicitrate transport regulator FecR n=1 Tax=Niastella vici TaxID=1703345 RepID=A0A1V9G0K1_9BACT|nr:FecR family protein [Niastella vici]OQP64110.1 hypothetical protein A3860_22145 [Niastella vici]